MKCRILVEDMRLKDGGHEGSSPYIIGRFLNNKKTGRFIVSDLMLDYYFSVCIRLGDVIIVDVRRMRRRGSDFLVRKFIGKEGDSIGKDLVCNVLGFDEFSPCIILVCEKEKKIYVDLFNLKEYNRKTLIGKTIVVEVDEVVAFDKYPKGRIKKVCAF